jgi:hypothetical protein
MVMVGTQEEGERQGYVKGGRETIGTQATGFVMGLLLFSEGKEMPRTVYLLKKNRNMAIAM